MNLSYDARGRLNTTSQGLGTDARTTDLAYYDSGASQGYLHTLTDALGRTVSQVGGASRPFSMSSYAVNLESQNGLFVGMLCN